MTIRFAQTTHPGKVREENQDSMARFQCPAGEVFMIADGMGGVEGGAAAARIAVDRFRGYMAAGDETLEQTAWRVNQDILRAAAANPGNGRMGATVVLAILRAGEVTIGHAGDSRAYLFRNRRLSQLTHDHSLVQKMLDARMLSDEEARRHPDSSVVTRWLGQADGFQLEITGPIRMQSGDSLLLCSDGLTRELDDSALERLLQNGGEPEDLARGLLSAALEHGGEDNITLQLVCFEPAVNGSTRLPRWLRWADGAKAAAEPAPRHGGSR